MTRRRRPLRCSCTKRSTSRSRSARRGFPRLASLRMEWLEPRLLLANDFWVSGVIPAGTAGSPFDQLQIDFSRAVDDATFTLDDVTVSDSGGLPIVPAGLTRLTASRYQLDLTGLTGLDTYSLAVGPDVLSDGDGQAMNQDRDSTPGEPEDAYRASLFSSGGTIAGGDPTYDDRSLVIYGDTLTVEGDHAFDLVGVYGGAFVSGSGEALDVHLLHVDEASTVTIAGGATLAVTNTITVTGNSTVLCQGKNTTAQVGGEWVGEGVTINAGSVVVDVGSTISADGQGYTSEKGPGAGHEGWYDGGGASHGGIGAGDVAGTTIYGSAIAPMDLGSGGGRQYTTPGRPGGGAIRLNVTGTLQLEGEIRSQGDSATVMGGAGAGGSIYVTAGSLAGDGVFCAHGGNWSENRSSGAGGGRIAVYYQTDAGFTGYQTSTALGGITSGGGRAGEGTVGFFQVADTANPTTDPDRHLHVYRLFRYEQEGAEVTIGGITVGSSEMTGAMLKIAGGSTVDIAASLTVTGDSVLLCESKNTTAQVGGEWVGEGVTINAGSVVVDAGSTISADGQGYTSQEGPGVGYEGWYDGGGASHGGIGAGDVAGTTLYGSAIAPMDVGSGGGQQNALPGRPGGGAIRLDVTGTLQLEGEIRAQGDSATVRGGAGSGGSIYVTAGSLAGDGSFRADGGNWSENRSSGAGGGRIAVYYQTDAGFTGYQTSTTLGGITAGGGRAGEGTVGFFQVADMANHTTDPTRVLSVYTQFRYPEEDEAVELGGLSLKAADGAGATLSIADGNSLRVRGDLTLGSPGATGALMTVGGGSTLDVGGTLTVADDSTIVCEGRYTTAPAVRDWVGEGVTILATEVTIKAGSAVTALGQGYVGGSSAHEGYGPGGGQLSGVYGGGGSHGGRGGLASGPTYGASYLPMEFGSGGAGEGDYWHGGVGGAGGGAVRLTVSGTLTLDGVLGANGQDEQDEVKDWTGGGAGGSLYVTADNFTGSGQMRADGGSTAVGGGGGGGRILLHAGTIGGTAMISANGGAATRGDTLTYEYNTQGRIRRATDPVGHVTTYTYDASGEHMTGISNATGTASFT